VVDIDASQSLERALDAVAKAITVETGLVVRSHRIDLLGLCTDCALTPASSGRPSQEF
jgi:hypothetical protein